MVTVQNNRATLRIAPPYTQAQISKIEAEFSVRLEQDVQFTVEEDSSLLGGFIAMIDGTVYDNSLATRLQTIRQSVSGPRNTSAKTDTELMSVGSYLKNRIAQVKTEPSVYEYGMVKSCQDDVVQIDGLPVSSTRVRAAIAAGEMEEAARLLGRPYALCGVIQRGKQLGRRLDFPTANLLWPEGKAIPPKGVYAARVYVDEAWYIAAVNVGTHPTAPGGPPTIEANLLDYEGGSLYGHHMRLLLCSFVRSEKKFDSLEALRDEVMKNREQVRTYFENRR